MEEKKAKNILNQAQQQYDGAFHLLNVTFPSIKDPKLFLGVINNIFTSLEKSMEAILTHEQQKCLVPNVPLTFLEKFRVFRDNSLERNEIPHVYLNLMTEMKSVIELHKKSPIEFRRGGGFVICNHNYEVRALSFRDLQQHLSKTQEFLKIAQKIVNSTESNK